MAKDFFDQDLVEARAVRSAPPPSAPEGGTTNDLPARTISDLNLTRMAKYREQRVSQQAESAKEMESLRRKADDLERERRTLEEETRQLDRFEQSRREVSERLEQALVMLETHEMQAIRLTELYAGTKHRFKELHESIRAIKEGEWDEARVREEINRAVVVIDEARKEYGKAMARLEAAESGSPGGGQGAAPALGAGGVAAETHGFLYWVKTGFAFFLPLMAFVVVAAVIVAVMAGAER
ncbi:MAG: hypothetical protein R6X19_07605 [Kiritimatiellia bacterium]